MATVKRKAVTDDRPSKKLKSAKVQKDPKPAKAPKPALEDSSERRPIPKSLLQQEGRAFPRGGASVLTPIEQKQIKSQAERDVLFEQQTGKVVAHEQDEEGQYEEGAEVAPVKKKKHQRQDKDTSKAADASTLKVQGLSYKNLSVGAVVLGYVTQVTSRDVELAIANNLSGYIPITAISDRLNGRIAKLLEEENEPENDEDDEDINLKELFYVGQWVRATVTATTSGSTDGDGRSKRHIELSVDPQHVNGGLESHGVVVNSMLQAAVRSVEDHGIVMDLGLASKDVRGFISKKDLGTIYKAEDVQEGQVMLCLVTGKGSSGKVINLTPGAVPRSAIAEGKQAPVVTEAPAVEGFQAGTAVDVLVTDNAPSGITGKVMGLLNITADLVHCGANMSADTIAKQLKIGSKAKGRIIWTIPNDDGSRRVGVSFLHHILALPPPSFRLPGNASSKLRSQSEALEKHEPLSSILESATVTHVVPNRGLYLKLSLPGYKEKANAFAHISQISDNRIDTLSSSEGKYKLESTHRARIISYNPVDDLYYVALKPTILEQQFLRIEDLTVGEAVKGKVERLILGAKGISGVLVKLSDSITGLVPEMHLSDTHLEHPERKFKEGYPVKARILSVDLDKKQVRLTLKKTLVNEDVATQIWIDYAELKPGMESKGTIVNIMRTGAAVQFFGNVRAWLPVAEMSDTFIENPEKHFRTGQTVNVRIVSVSPESQQMKVSCKDSSAFDTAMQDAWDDIKGGEIVTGTVTEKSPEAVMVELENGLRGSIRVGHLSDTATADPEKASKRIHVSKTLGELVVLHKLDRSRRVLLTRKASMLEDTKSGALLSSYDNVSTGRHVNGFVRNVTPEGVYIEFAGGVVGLLPKSQVAPAMMGKPAFGLVRDQSISAWVSNVDAARARFSLTMREQTQQAAAPAQLASIFAIANPADPTITSLADFSLGRVTKARVTSVKGSQLNVRLADGIPGRVDVSEAFDSWNDFKNNKFPLQKFKPNEIITVKILGIHDARNHRFLPISHRSSGAPVFELSAKKSRVENGDESGLTMNSIQVGAQHLAFVNNHGDSCVWVNVSPNVRGRIALMDLSDDAGQLQSLEKNFPVGCALRVTVKDVNASLNRLDLVARTGRVVEKLTLDNISKGTVLTARITKVTERAVVVQLSDTLSAPVPMFEISDDYDNINLTQYNKNDIVRVCVLDVDTPNKKLHLSMRPSRVLSSSLPVTDPQIASFGQIKKGDILRGFVKNVADRGVYVSLGARVDAFVRISDLSDKYVKDWKTIVQVDELVKGRILSVDSDSRHALLSLKPSAVDTSYTPPLTINDLEPGMIVTGKVRKVEDFGAFIDIDNTQPRLSGLCHRSEIAAKRVEDVRKIYSARDVVKAKVLTVDVEGRKISLGLKATYFNEGTEEEVDQEDEDDVEAVSSVDEDVVDEDVAMDGGIDLSAIQDLEMEDDEEESESDDGAADIAIKPTGGLKTSGFDWSGAGDTSMPDAGASDSEVDIAAPKKRKRNKPEIKADLTGDLDKYGARSVDDFERVLLGQPNDSGLWIQYMAFQLQLSELQRAREVAERALRTIHIRELDEKANIWIAYLNLEVEYGDDERVEEVFKDACQVQDALEMHEKLASIYIDSGKHDKADAMFERMAGNKAFRASPAVWFNYATFLIDTLKAPARARSLLSRALQSIPVNEHRSLTARFAALEFRSSHGDPERGRTIFEGLVAEYPKWSSGWDMFVDLERARLSSAGNEQEKVEAKEKVRALYERIVGAKMKKRRARFVFKRWLEFENKEGNAKSAERVQALAKEYVERLQAQGGGDGGDE